MGTLGSSDHVLLEFTILGKGKIVQSHTCRLDFRKANFNQLKLMLGRIPRSAILKEKGVQEGWEFLKNEILKAQITNHSYAKEKWEEPEEARVAP